VYKNIVFLIVFFAALSGYSQAPLNTYEDISPLLSFCPSKEPHNNKVSPGKAMTRSLIFPGWGQMSNRQYWKVPVLYCGFALSIYSIVFAGNNYRDFKTAYILRSDNDPDTIDKYDPQSNSGKPSYSENQLKLSRDYYKRNMELSIIITTGIYLLNIVDAYVSAHLRSFDISDDLSLGLSSLRTENIYGNRVFFSGLNLHFK
jgi:hypothetical protein